MWYRLNWTYRGLTFVDGSVSSYESTGSTNVKKDSDTLAIEWACKFIVHLRNECVEFSLTRIDVEGVVAETRVSIPSELCTKLE